MKHLGNITKINGAEVPPVDVIIGGSPCQDLSIAGKRAGLAGERSGLAGERSGLAGERSGLAGERSGLFMEQIRIVRQMRERTDNLFPRYMLWENVPGALSSNGGEDFRAVLEETAKIADENAAVPRLKDGKWTKAGCILADGWSIAWRVLDAQFWGVPQRRARIALVADFRGQSGPEILFERKGVSRDFAPGGTEGQGTAGNAESGINGTGECFCLQGNGIDRADTAGCNGRGWTNDISYMLNTIDRPAVVYEIGCFKYKQGANSRSVGYEINKAPTLDADGGHPPAIVQNIYDARGNGNGNVAATITGDHEAHISDYTNVVISESARDMTYDMSITLKAQDGAHGAPSIVGRDMIIRR